jgi:hypothetical protein
MIVVHLLLLAAAPLIAFVFIVCAPGRSQHSLWKMLSATVPFLVLGLLSTLSRSIAGAPVIEWVLPALCVLLVGAFCESERLFARAHGCLLPVAVALCANFMFLVRHDYTANPRSATRLNAARRNAVQLAAGKALRDNYRDEESYPAQSVDRFLHDSRLTSVAETDVRREWHTPFTRLYRVARHRAMLWYPGGSVGEASRQLMFRSATAAGEPVPDTTEAGLDYETERAKSPIPPPKRFQSPSGAYTLVVTPINQYEVGRARYRMSKGEQLVWSGVKGFRLSDARVTDDGVTAGYAVAWDDPLEAGDDVGPGNFRVVIIDPRGRERFNQVAKREPVKSHVDLPPYPPVAGLIMDLANDRVVVRANDSDQERDIETWWAYRISTGTSLAVVRPKEVMPDPKPARHIIDARPVAGTPLLLLHWRRAVPEPELTIGARFTLIELDGKPVWTLELPHDYEFSDYQAEWEKPGNEIASHRAILRSDQPGRFDLRFVKEAQRVTFTVSRNERGIWNVSEVQRRPYAETGGAFGKSRP